MFSRPLSISFLLLLWNDNLLCYVYHPRIRIGNNFRRVCVSVQAITFEPSQPGLHFQYRNTHWPGVGQVWVSRSLDQGQIKKNYFTYSLLLYTCILLKFTWRSTQPEGQGYSISRSNEGTPIFCLLQMHLLSLCYTDGMPSTEKYSCYLIYFLQSLKHFKIHIMISINISNHKPFSNVNVHHFWANFS